MNPINLENQKNGPEADRDLSLASEDPRVLAALKEFQAALEAGLPLNRQEFLARHADIALDLTEGLEALEWMQIALHQVKPAAVDLRELVGDQVGDYKILEEIGRGGMGVVYRGHDAGLDRVLAIKVLLNEHEKNTELVKRFLEEARIMGQLQHPGVAPIHEVGWLKDGRPFFSMKQIKGQTLAELLKGQEPAAKGQESGIRNQKTEPGTSATDKSPSTQHATPSTHHAQFLPIFEQICQTVAFAHSRGILHRDLKPANVMVGAFGEVQVMDWGLAKQMRNEERGTMNQKEAVTAIPHSSFLVPHSEDTETGRVLGTPAYMAPEQARGQVESLDERCDVFGLGAILCQILTGRPPFPGDTKIDSHRRAISGDLGEALGNLDSCGADAELVNLAKHCLSPQRENRPRHAGEVAQAIASYQTAVRERLRQAEIERAASQVKVAEERKRRRISLAFAGVAVLFLVAAGSAGLWYYQDRATRAEEEGQRKGEQARLEAEKTARQQQLTKDIGAALNNTEKFRKALQKKLANAQEAAQLLSDMDLWHSLVSKARDAWKQANFILGGSQGLLDDSWATRLAALDKQLQADEQNWDLARKLDDIRLEAATLVEGQWQPDIAAKRYPLFFQQMGLDVENGKAAEVAKQISGSPLRHALVAALDHWAVFLPGNSALQTRLLEITRLADPDPWRDQVRNEKNWRDVKKLKELSKTAEPDRQTPQIISLLGLRLYWKGHNEEAGTLLRQALMYHPRDFWLHFQRGTMVKDPAEQAGCFTAALVVRPDSAPAHNNLGHVLRNRKDLEGAIAHFKKAISLNPDFALAHNNLGNALRLKKDWQGAVFHFQKALTLDPKFAAAQTNLGNVLRDQKNLEEAIHSYHKALELNPNHAQAHLCLGMAKQEQKNLEGAIASYQKAIAIDPKYAQAHFKLGLALREQKNLKEAMLHLKKALDLEPADAAIPNAIGNTLFTLKNTEGAIGYYLKAIALDPGFAPAHYNMGLALYQKKDHQGAITYYQKAIALDPEYAAPHINLGMALYDQKDFKGAISHYQKAIELDPDNAKIYYNLGNALSAQKNLKGALPYFEKAVALEPDFAHAHNNLGMVLQELSDFNQAAVHFQKAITLNPKDAIAHNNLGLVLYEQKKLAEAITHYQKAIALDSKLAQAHNNLGNALKDNQDWQGAIAHYQKALSLNPNYAKAHNNLGNILFFQKDLDGAISHLKKAIAIDPNYVGVYPLLARALLLQGQIAQARAITLQILKYYPAAHPQRKSMENQLAYCDRLLEWESKWPAILQGQIQAKDPREQLEWAELCVGKKHYLAAARFYAAALAAPSKTLPKPYYPAASAALLAASGKGKDTNELKTDEPVKLRNQALTWLQEELARLKKQLATNPKKTDTTRLMLEAWNHSPDLASVRQKELLDKLPEGERKAWNQFWSEVQEVLR